MDKALRATLATPHLELAPGPYGWTCTIRANNGMVLAYGFAEGQAITAKGAAVKAALSQIAS